jgi:hypothetical protein
VSYLRFDQYIEQSTRPMICKLPVQNVSDWHSCSIINKRMQYIIPSLLFLIQTRNTKVSCSLDTRYQISCLNKRLTYISMLKLQSPYSISFRHSIIYNVSLSFNTRIEMKWKCIYEVTSRHSSITSSFVFQIFYKIYHFDDVTCNHLKSFTWHIMM